MIMLRFGIKYFNGITCKGSRVENQSERFFEQPFASGSRCHCDLLFILLRSVYLNLMNSGLCKFNYVRLITMLRLGCLCVMCLIDGDAQLTCVCRLIICFLIINYVFPQTLVRRFYPRAQCSVFYRLINSITFCCCAKSEQDKAFAFHFWLDLCSLENCAIDFFTTIPIMLFFVIFPHSDPLTRAVGRDVELRNETKVGAGRHAGRFTEVRYSSQLFLLWDVVFLITAKHNIKYRLVY